MTNETIQETLIKSCGTLHSQGIINDNQLNLCLSEIDADKYGKSLEIEEKIMGESRLEKIKKYNKFISELNNLKTKIFDKLKEKEIDNSNKEDYYKILIVLDKFINELLNYINMKIVSKHERIELSHYNKLMNNYGKIDNNRKELNKINGSLDLVNRLNEIDKEKYEDSSIMTSLIFTIILILILIVCIFMFYKIVTKKINN